MNLSFRLILDKLFFLLISALSLCLMIPLFMILYYIVKNGLPAITFEFLTHNPKPIGETGGGIANAIVGSFIVVSIASLIAVPLGLFSGIYLSENPKGWWSTCVRFCVDIFQGIPSIVIGIVAYVWIVIPMGHFSAISGGIALALMMMSVIVRSTEETLKLIPHSLKEASLALGVSYSRTIMKVIVPSGMNGILTGVLLGLARVAGETAPLLFTAFGNPYMSLNVSKPVNSIPLLIFNYATSPYEEWQRLGWGASFVLVAFVLATTLLTKLVSRKNP